jgi:predicted O-methyltransferase YrrM
MLRLAWLGATRPGEFVDRVQVIWESRAGKHLRRGRPSKLEEAALSLPEALERLSRRLRVDLCRIVEEGEFRATKAAIRKVTGDLLARGDLPFPLSFNADSGLIDFCYALCRALRPPVVVETGVGYGVTSSTILAALAKNGCGELYSIDLPPLGDSSACSDIGIMVPWQHRSRWHLQRGSSRRLLSDLLRSKRSSIGVFVHDSANVYPVQRMEMETVWPGLSAGGAMIVNNASAAFEGFVGEVEPADAVVARGVEKRGNLLGVVVKA